MLEGSCLCGDVRFRILTDPKAATICHCSQCRKQSGHIWASANVSQNEIEVSGPVTWYQSSPSARRGFCPRCGSFLFWKALDEDIMGFALGALEPPTGLRIEKHIFVGSKGDYYDITDGLPQEAMEE